MGITHLSGLEVAGVPIINSGGAPFFTGKWIFADAVYGSDGNPGTADSPVQTLTQAYSMTTEGKNDVVVLVGHPTTAAASTGTFRLSAQLDWAKSATHLVGMCAPTMIGQRARISTATGATANIADLLKVSAQGCYFANFSMFQGVGEAATAEKLCQITGQRNYFYNVAFQGIGSANGGGQSGSYVLNMNGGSENTFVGCQFGVDTQARSTTNTTILFQASATRNIWQDCVFPIYASSASALMITAGATSIDRFAWFKNCLFVNAIDSAATVMTALCSTNASQGGVIIMDNCTVIGVTNYSATNPDANVKVSGSVPNGHTSGIALSAATS